MTDPSTGTTWFFDARCWLDAGRGDGATERRLAASLVDPRSLRAAVQYQARTGARGRGRPRACLRS